MAAPRDLDSIRELGEHKSGNAFLVDPNRPETPVWFDQTRFDAGRAFFRRHVLSVAFGYFCSLYVGFTVDSLAGAVAFTGESDTADRSRHRYLHTMGHLFSWHTSDIINDPNSIGYRSIRYVRLWHDRIRKRLADAASPMVDTSEDDYISQYDTAMVQSGFVAPIVLHTRQFGVRCSMDELSDYVYFWRVVGYILGLDDETNACGASDLLTIERIAEQIEREIVAPGLLVTNARFEHLSETLIDGFRRFWPWLNGRVIRGYVCPLMGLPSPSDLSWKDYVVVKLLKAHFFFMQLIPCYASYWNGKVFALMERLLPSAVIP